MTARTAVLNGIKYLNEHHPGWLSRIDLDTLDLKSCQDCVLGQVFGEYCYPSPLEVQFNANHGFTASLTNYDYFHLNRVWKEELRKLKADENTL